MKTKVKILLIYTGGTIGMMKDFETGALKAFNFAKLLNKIPELKQLDCIIETYSFENPIDSSNMNPKKWAALASILKKQYKLYDGFVVLHGSDTMSYTASALSFMLQNLTKPVIFTGSQLPIGDLRTDAKENLITAIQIAALQENEGAVFKEVCLYFEHKLYRGNRTTKISAEHFNAFTSPNFPALAESGVHIKVNTSYNTFLADKKPLSIQTKMDTNVVILKLFPGISKQVLKAVFDIPNLKGIVLETYGSGNAPSENWFLNLLENTIQKGIYIVNTTQCSGGSVSMGHYETSASLKAIGVISGKDITTEAAITKLMFLLTQDIAKKDFKSVFEMPICGEIS